MEKHKLDVPFDMQTRYLHGVNVRLEETNILLASLISLLTPKVVEEVPVIAPRSSMGIVVEERASRRKK